ncbi:unnamed protein product [Closterium sp. NIES-54]
MAFKQVQFPSGFLPVILIASIVVCSTCAADPGFGIQSATFNGSNLESAAFAATTTRTSRRLGILPFPGFLKCALVANLNAANVQSILGGDPGADGVAVIQVYRYNGQTNVNFRLRAHALSSSPIAQTVNKAYSGNNGLPVWVVSGQWSRDNSNDAYTLQKWYYEANKKYPPGSTSSVYSILPAQPARRPLAAPAARSPLACGLLAAPAARLPLACSPLAAHAARSPPLRPARRPCGPLAAHLRPASRPCSRSPPLRPARHPLAARWLPLAAREPPSGRPATARPAAARPTVCHPAGRPSRASPCPALRASLVLARHPALPAMASLSVLTFDHEGHPIQFDTWLDELQLYLLSDSRDIVSLFHHTSGASLAPPAPADSATRSQWLMRDATARLAVHNHLLLAERAHFGQHKTAKALYDAVVARYSSPATAALGRLLLPYLFPELSAFATVEDRVTHLCTSDARYHAVFPAEDHFFALDPTHLTVDLLGQHLLAAETSIVAIGAARGTPHTPFFEGCSPSPLAPSYASAAAVDILGAEDVGAASAISGKHRSSKGKGGRSGGGGSGGGGGGDNGGGGGSGGGGTGGSGGGSGGLGGVSGGGGGGGGSGCSGSGDTRGGAVQGGGSGGGQRQQQQRPSETPSPQQLCEWFAQRGAYGCSV